jgi:hypothetical protein
MGYPDGKQKRQGLICKDACMGKHPGVGPGLGLSDFAA